MKARARVYVCVHLCARMYPHTYKAMMQTSSLSDLPDGAISPKQVVHILGGDLEREVPAYTYMYVKPKGMHAGTREKNTILDMPRREATPYGAHRCTPDKEDPVHLWWETRLRHRKKM
jgi:hypothetical protein